MDQPLNFVTPISPSDWPAATDSEIIQCTGDAKGSFPATLFAATQVSFPAPRLTEAPGRALGPKSAFLEAPDEKVRSAWALSGSVPGRTLGSSAAVRQARGMTDAQQAFDQQVVTPSDVTSDRELVSPAISITSVQYGGHLEPANQANPHQLASGAPAAYTTNPYSGAGSHALDFHAGQAFHVPARHAALYTKASPDELGSSSNQTPTLGNFGSQAWVPPSPYLSFAPQPIYEPTGELIDEHIRTFDQFDSPPSRQSSEILTAQRALQPTGVTGQLFSANFSSSKGIIAPPPPLRSALKRKVDSDANSPSNSESGRRKQSAESGFAVARTVSFSRMSDSEGDGPASSEAGVEEASSRAGPSRTAKQGSQRPVEQSFQGDASTKSPTTAPKPAGKGTGILYKQKPSAPSILPPEKVFPIQIGSELFRLSGASISSDGLSVDLQFHGIVN